MRLDAETRRRGDKRGERSGEDGDGLAGGEIPGLRDARRKRRRAEAALAFAARKGGTGVSGDDRHSAPRRRSWRSSTRRGALHFGVGAEFPES
jgi:hypothetical protein